MRTIAAAAGGRFASGHPPPEGLLAKGYSFDTRGLKPGEIFFALDGERRNGHQFLSDAWAKGAAGAVVAQPAGNAPQDFVQIVVSSPLDALQALASHVREDLKIPVVAISGSNGKTTTKEMLAHILSGRMHVHKSPGNFNNHIGVPLTILGLDETAQVLVMELGSNHRGEIEKLSRISRPHIGVITNVGRAHIGLFGSVEEIAREKTDLLRCLEPEGKGVVNADDRILLSAIAHINVDLVRFGVSEDAEFRATEIRQLDGGGCAFRLGRRVVTLKTGGSHNVYNALAAVSTASLLGVTVRDAARALETFEPVRTKVTSCCGVTLIDDSYNANPDSVRAALELLTGTTARRRVLIMGEMLELGEESRKLHREIGELVAASDIHLFVGIGGDTEEAVTRAKAGGMGSGTALFFETKAEAKRRISDLVRRDDVVLVKGSRMTGLEEICDFLREMVKERT
jgi:UDP-N-acetylmuramoyl-tripeptide--D-alanyl-D-alanine ligase